MADVNELWLNLVPATGTTARDFFTAQPASFPSLKEGDTVLLKVRLLKPVRDGDRVFADVFESGMTVKVSLGVPGLDFEDGGAILTHDGDSTAELASKPTAAEIETALNALASITSDGGVKVRGVDGGPWRVIWDSVGARNLITADVRLLFPTGVATIEEVTTGDGSTREEQLITIEPDIVAEATSFSNLESAAITVTSLRTGSATQSAIQRIDLSDPEPYGGIYAVDADDAGDVTEAIVWNATAADLQAALRATTAAAACEVSGSFPTFEVDFITKAAKTTMSGDASGLLVATGKKGDLDLDTTKVAELLAGKASVPAVLEAEVTTAGGDPMTPVQIPVLLVNDLNRN